MSWIEKVKDKFLGSDLAVTRPDFSNSPELELDFKLAKVRLRHAMHTAMFPIHDEPRGMDISDVGALKKQKTGEFAREVYVRGWTLKGRGDRGIGGVEASAVILNFCNKLEDSNSYNCFESGDFEQEVIEYLHRLYGRQNEGASIGSLGDAYYRYPVAARELEYRQLNDINWCTFSAGKPGAPGEVGFIAALSRNHLLIIDFKLKAYKGGDYFSPETNVQQACESIVKDFMDNVHIELSPQVLEDKRNTLAASR